MDFTEIYRQTSGLVTFSPGAHFILTAVQDRLVIRRADSFQVERTWQVLPPADTPSQSGKFEQRYNNTSAQSSAGQCRITHAGWSCDSEYVLAACSKQGFVNVFKLRDDAWSARIDAGLEGLVKAEWAPDGRSILCFSDMGVSFSFRMLSIDSRTQHSFRTFSSG